MRAWNNEYWKLKYDIVGTAPPVERSEEEAFLDPPTLFHINQVHYIIYS